MYVEDDPGFFVRVSLAASREYIIVSAGDIVTSEVRLIPASDPCADPLLVAPRRAGHEYEVDHQGDRFVIRTNDRHKNSRLATAPADDPTERAWVPLVEPSDSHHIRGFDAFRDFIAVEERIEGLDQVRLIDRAGESTYVEFPEPVYSAYLGGNPEFETDEVRLEYTSLVTPSTVFDYHVDTGELEVRKVQEIPSGYDSSRYVTERVKATARDGVQVPASIVRRKDTPVEGTAPLYVYAYGSYGYAVPPSFSASRLSLLDRGFIYAIAHVRGGDDLGYHWYEAGKLERRKKHVQRLRRRCPLPGRAGVRQRGARGHIRGQRRGAGDGRGGEPGAGAMGRGGGARSIRGRADYDPGRHAAPHAHRVAGVGQPD